MTLKKKILTILIRGEMMFSFRQVLFMLIAASLICLSTLCFLNSVKASPCPDNCTTCKAEVVYVYMIYDPEAKKAENAWVGDNALDLVQWTTQDRAWVTTRRAQAESKKASLLSGRGKRSVVRKFFLVESLKTHD